MNMLSEFNQAYADHLKSLSDQQEMPTMVLIGIKQWAEASIAADQLGFKIMDPTHSEGKRAEWCGMKVYKVDAFDLIKFCS